MVEMLALKKPYPKNNEGAHAKQHEHFTGGDGVRAAKCTADHEEFADGHQNRLQGEWRNDSRGIGHHLATENWELRK